MSNLSRIPAAVNPAPADTWPAWTDEEVYGLGPAPEDARWAAENLNDDWHTDEPPPPELEGAGCPDDCG